MPKMNLSACATREKEITAILVRVNTNAKREWKAVGRDDNNSRLSFKDYPMLFFHVDIYLSTMTIMLQPSGDKPLRLKRQEYKDLENLFREPEAFYNSHI